MVRSSSPAQVEAAHVAREVAQLHVVDALGTGAGEAADWRHRAPWRWGDTGCPRHLGRLSAPGRARPSATTASISTCAPRGSAATPTVTRAGGSSAKNPRVHLVDLAEALQVGHVDRQPHRPLERGLGRRAHRLQVLQAAARLLGRTGSHQLAARRVQGDLARAEQQLPRPVPRGCTGRSPLGPLGRHDLTSAVHRPDPTRTLPPASEHLQGTTARAAGTARQHDDRYRRRSRRPAAHR